MSKYTTELRYVLKEKFDLGMNSYPIFDEGYRSVLNAKIYDHFLFREIGFETVALFKHYLNRKMNEIMPLYNQYYESQLLKFDPITNYKGKEEQEHKSRTDTDSTSNFVDSYNDKKRSNDTSHRTNERHDSLSELHEDNSQTVYSPNNHVTVEHGKKETHSGQDTTVYDSGERVDRDLLDDNRGKGQDITDFNRQYSDTPQDSFPEMDIDANKFLTNATKEQTKFQKNTGYDLRQTGFTNSKKTGSDTLDHGHTITDSGNDITTTTGKDDTKGITNGYVNNENWSDTDENLVRDYVDTFTHDDVSATIDSSDTNLSENWIKELVGYSGQSPSKLLNEFRSTFMNIDMLIINELEPLFMGLW